MELTTRSLKAAMGNTALDGSADEGCGCATSGTAEGKGAALKVLPSRSFWRHVANALLDRSFIAAASASPVEPPLAREPARVNAMKFSTKSPPWKTSLGLRGEAPARPRSCASSATSSSTVWKRSPRQRHLNGGESSATHPWTEAALRSRPQKP